MGQSLLHRGASITKSATLLQTGTGIRNWRNHYKVSQSLLQKVVGIIKCGNFIAKWDHYYKKSHRLFLTLGE